MIPEGISLTSFLPTSARTLFPNGFVSSLILTFKLSGSWLLARCCSVISSGTWSLSLGYTLAAVPQPVSLDCASVAAVPQLVSQDCVSAAAATACCPMSLAYEKVLHTTR